MKLMSATGYSKGFRTTLSLALSIVASNSLFRWKDWRSIDSKVEPLISTSALSVDSFLSLA